MMNAKKDKHAAKSGASAAQQGKQSKKGGAEQTPDSPTETEAKDNGQAALQKRVAELEDKLLRALADKENAVKRVQRDSVQSAQRAVLETASRMFEVADNLERAIDAQDSSQTAIIEGVALTLSQLRSILSGLGIQTINPSPGEPQDPNLHQTIIAEQSNEHSPGTIIRVAQRGYLSGGMVLRAASVVVAKKHTAQTAAQKAGSDGTGSELEPAK